MTAQGAFLKLSEIRKNQKTGQGPCTLADMRREADLAREREEAERQAEARRQISLERFWDEDYFLALKNRIKPNSWEKEEAHFRRLEKSTWYPKSCRYSCVVVPAPPANMSSPSPTVPAIRRLLVPSGQQLITSA